MLGLRNRKNCLPRSESSGAVTFLNELPQRSAREGGVLRWHSAESLIHSAAVLSAVQKERIHRVQTLRHFFSCLATLLSDQASPTRQKQLSKAKPDRALGCSKPTRRKKVNDRKQQSGDRKQYGADVVQIDKGKRSGSFQLPNERACTWHSETTL